MQNRVRQWARTVLRDPFSSMVDVASALQVLQQTGATVIAEDDLAWLEQIIRKKLLKGVKNRRRLRKILSTLR